VIEMDSIKTVKDNLTVDVYGYLKYFGRLYVKVDKKLRAKIKEKIAENYRSLADYNRQELNINVGTLRDQLNRSTYFQFQRLLKVIQSLDVSKEELLSNIKQFYYWGSRNRHILRIPREIEIDEFFVEGYALYLAEGDTGLNGNSRASEFVFTNSEVGVINHMIRWVKTFFPGNHLYVRVINPEGESVNFETFRKLINLDKIKFKVGYYNKIPKYRVCLNLRFVIDLMFAIENRIREAYKTNEKLAAAYVRGMMIGEGTAYFNKSRYVRIEMRNEKEIKYLHKLFTLLGFDCKPYLRTNRHNMWSLYIGAKQLRRYYDLIGFGVHKKRQAILEKAVNKKLRVNQYC